MRGTRKLCSVIEESHPPAALDFREFDLGNGFSRCRSSDDMPEIIFGGRNCDSGSLEPPLFQKSSRRRSLPDIPAMEIAALTHAPASTKAYTDVHTLIPGVLSFCAHKSELVQYPSHYNFISTKLAKMYKPICSDFGPVRWETVINFCDKIKGRLQSNSQKRHQVVCCGSDEKERANAYFLLASYLVLELDWPVDQACGCFENAGVKILAFRDASNLPSDFFLSLRDCVSAVSKAKRLGWFSALVPRDCGMKASLAMADLSIICPKVFAFHGPVAGAHRGKSAGFGPEHYAHLLSKLGAAAVIQLNQEVYPRESFTANGIQHHFLPLPDGKVPSIERVRSFLEVCDAVEGGIGVHCRGGLGRTGTMIAAWLMRGHGFSAREAMAWLRIVRPGSVIGAQQHFLERHEERIRALSLNNPNSQLQSSNPADTASTEAFSRSSSVSSAATAPSRPEQPRRASMSQMRCEDVLSLAGSRGSSNSSSGSSLLERLLAMQTSESKVPA